MCYNISAKTPAKELENRFKAKVADNESISPHFYLSGFNHPKTPVISSIQPDVIQTFYWGLVPSFCQTMKDAKDMMTKTLNAKSETIFALPSFKNSIPKKRCLVLVDGFYEWRTIGKQKYPYYIHTKDNEPFAFGGIYNDWVNKETGEIISTFSIITTEANPLLAKIHNVKLRMPLILPKEVEKEWLNPNLKPKEITELMKPLDENLLEAHTISKLITNRNDNPDKKEVQIPFEYPELAMYDM
jgi:putative SOS response-associated peptidase YedK